MLAVSQVQKTRLAVLLALFLLASFVLLIALCVARLCPLATEAKKEGGKGGAKKTQGQHRFAIRAEPEPLILTVLPVLNQGRHRFEIKGLPRSENESPPLWVKTLNLKPASRTHLSPPPCLLLSLSLSLSLTISLALRS